MIGLSNAHIIPLSDIYRRLHSTKHGLTEEQSLNLRKRYGLNLLSQKKQVPLIIRFLMQFKNFFSILLLIGALLSFIADYFSPGEGSIIVGFALVGVTFLNAAFTFFQEFKAEQAMKSFQNLLPQKILVDRAGKHIFIESQFLVPGDVIFLEEGDKVPADCRLIEAYLLKVDHSMLTGESEPQLRSLEKTSDTELLSRNMVFSGTLIQSGHGRAIVVRTGDTTEIGKIAHLTTSVKEKNSKIKDELQEFVKIISSIAIVLGVVFFGLGFAIGNSLWENMLFAIGIIVANVPEGLLPTVTLTLSLAAQKMARNNALVKDIESIETIGSITAICTDKTGTLTQNKLTVTQLYCNGISYTFDGFHKVFFDSKSAHHLHHVTDSTFNLILDTMFLCNNSEIHLDGRTAGDPTEIALKQSVATQKKIDVVYEDTFREEEIPFDSERKYMITVVKQYDERMAHLKGSVKEVIAKSTKILHNGKVIALTKKEVNKLLKINDELSSKGQRVLALAYKNLHHHDASPGYLENESYTFLGLVALQDPPREGVAKAVSECYTAGVRVVVVSGDQEITVTAIAKQVGIIRPTYKPLLVDGDKLSHLSDKKLEHLLSNKSRPVIFSRVLPKDKLRVVQALQSLGEIVAVTGDGVNDAPALKQADVGVAMGKSGTAVAQDAANMVLLDDNFATIVKAIKRGRTVFDNIKKFILYILTSNVPEILPFLFLVLFDWPLALPVLLILAIDLGTDMIPAISLGMESSEEDVMKQPPRDTKSKLLTSRMLALSYGLFGLLQAITAFVVFFIVLYGGGWHFGEPIATTSNLYMSAVTAFFAAIVITQIFNQLSCRTVRLSAFKKSLRENKLFFVGMFVELLLIFLMMYFKPLQIVFGTQPFALWLFPIMILGGIIVFGSDELRKYFFRKKGLFGVY